MRKEQLTTAEALGFARHDFLNKLQIVLMHIDLGDVLEARKSIFNATDEMRQQSRLELLGLPETSKWLMAFGWMYPTYQKTLICTGGKPGDREADDVEVTAYLEHVFQDVEKLLDPNSEYEAHIEVDTTLAEWSIQITIHGAMLGHRPAMKTGESFTVKETKTHNYWTFTLSGQ